MSALHSGVPTNPTYVGAPMPVKRGNRWAVPRCQAVGCHAIPRWAVMVSKAPSIVCQHHARLSHVQAHVMRNEFLNACHRTENFSV